MKCPGCARVQKYREGMKCSQCGYAFAVNPKEHAGLTDSKLLALFRAASASGEKYFTINQLYALAIRGKSRYGIADRLIVIFMFFVCFMALSAINENLFFMILFLIIAAFILATSTNIGFKKSTLESALVAYFSAHPKPDRYLEQPALHSPPPPWPEDDIYDYGVDSVVIVNRDILVDLLVRNGAHQEMKSLILSVNRYPSYIYSRLEDIARQNKNLKFFLLHDTDCGSFHEDAQRNILEPLGARRVVDLGLDASLAQRHRVLKPLAVAQEETLVDHLPNAVLIPLLVGSVLAETTFLELLLADEAERLGWLGFHWHSSLGGEGEAVGDFG